MSVEIERNQDGYVVVATRSVGVSSSVAFAAWTEPQHLNAWFTHGATVDLRVGGKYSNGDGDSGTYLVVEAPHLLAFTWEQAMHCPGSEVELTFQDTPTGSTVTLRHGKLHREEDARDLAAGGWDWAMDSYASYLNTGSGISYEDWKLATAP